MALAVNHPISLDEQCDGGIAGDRKQLDPRTIIIRRHKVETAWQIVDSICAGWQDKPLTNR